MFLGTHTPKLDDKGRLALPAKFRPELAQGVVVTKGQEGCVFVYPQAAFVAEAERRQVQAAADPGDRAARTNDRLFFASAFPQELDGQGRITVPPPLRDYAGLDKDCVVLGANTRLEIWDAQAWATYEQEQEAVFAGIT